MSSNDIIKEVFSFENKDDLIQFEAEMIHLDLINEILKLMDLRKMNKAELAKFLGTTKGYVTQLFSGDRLLNLKTLAKIQQIFDVRIKLQFVEKTKSKKAENKPETSIRKTVKKSSKTHQVKYLERHAYLK